MREAPPGLWLSSTRSGTCVWLMCRVLSSGRSLSPRISVQSATAATASYQQRSGAFGCVGVCDWRVHRRSRRESQRECLWSVEPGRRRRKVRARGQGGVGSWWRIPKTGEGLNIRFIGGDFWARREGLGGKALRSRKERTISGLRPSARAVSVKDERGPCPIRCGWRRRGLRVCVRVPKCSSCAPRDPSG